MKNSIAVIKSYFCCLVMVCSYSYAMKISELVLIKGEFEAMMFVVEHGKVLENLSQQKESYLYDVYVDDKESNCFMYNTPREVCFKDNIKFIEHKWFDVWYMCQPYLFLLPIKEKWFLYKDVEMHEKVQKQTYSKYELNIWATHELYGHVGYEMRKRYEKCEQHKREKKISGV